MASGDKRATNSEREAAKQLRPDLAIARILKRQVEKVVGPRDALVSIEIGQCHSLSSADFHLVRSRRTTLLSMGRRMAEMLERFDDRSIENVGTQCPLWVISRRRRRTSECPLYSRKRTSPRVVGMSAKCQ